MTTAAQRGHLSFALTPSSTMAVGDALPLANAPRTANFQVTQTAVCTATTATTTSFNMSADATAQLAVGDLVQFADDSTTTSATHTSETGEVMRITAISASSPFAITVLRGQAGTTAVAHTGGAVTVWRLASSAGFATDADGFWTTPLLGATLAVSEMTEMLPPELGSTLFTRGGYKAGAFMAGAAQFEVRLEKYIGKFLQAMGGAPVATTPLSAGGSTTKSITAMTASATDTTMTIATGSGIAVGDYLTFGAAADGVIEEVLVTAAITGDTVWSIARACNGTALQAISGVAYRKPRNAVTVFQPSTTNEVAAPYMYARRYVPDSQGGAGYTEYGFDGRAISLSLNLPQAGAATGEFSAVFRRPYSVDGEKELNGTTAVVASAIPGMSEAAASLGLSCTSNISFPALGIKSAADAIFTGGQVTLANAPVSPQDGFGIGSYHPEDWTLLGRGATIRLAYKWKDDGLYNQIVYAGDGASFGNWAPQIKYTDVLITVKAAGNAPVGGKPYELVIFIPNAALNMSAPRLDAGRFITTELVAVASWNGVTRGAPWMAFLYNDATY